VASRWLGSRRLDAGNYGQNLCALALLFVTSVAGVSCAGDDRPPALPDYEGNGGDGEQTGAAATGGSGSSGSGGSGGMSGSGGSGGVGGSGGSGAVSGSGGSGAASGSGGSGAASGGCVASSVYDDDFTALDQSTLRELQGYEVVSGDLYIGGNIDVLTTDVSSLEVLSCLKSVEGDFSILDSPNLVDLAGLEQLETVSRLSVVNNAGLETLAHLQELTVIGTLTVNDNPSLSELGEGIVTALSVVMNDNPSLAQCEVEALADRVGVAQCYCASNDPTGTCD
jgi:hypothetical protein